MRPPPSWKESARFPVTAATAVLAIAVSLAWWAGADVSFLWMDPHIRRGEVWRFVTSALVHVNVLHLAFDVYWLWALGPRVEEAFGSLRTAGIYVLLAVVSGAAEYALFHGGVGLSGVGYGLFGLVWVLHRRDPRFEDAIDGRTVGLFVVWFFVCIVATATEAMNVGNVAHGVGAVAGLLLGDAIAPRTAPRAVPLAALALTAVASLLGATVARGSVNLTGHPGAGEARLGYEALVADENEEARRWLSDATAVEPDDAGSWFNLGIAHQRTGHIREAASAFDTAHRLKPDNPKFKPPWAKDR